MKAEVNSIAKMKLFWLLRPKECSNKQPTESMDRIIYEVELENGSSRVVSFGDISNLVGDEKSTQGDTNCLLDLGSTLISFHLHSFVTFYTEMQKKTIITCVLTTRHHIHSNMQD